MRILIITSCTGQKAYKPSNQLTQDDFRQMGTDIFSQREEALADYRLPAREMYTGQQHIRLLRGLDILREACPAVTIDLKIISAGYGLVDETTPVAPYEMTFNSMKVKELREWADFLNIPEAVLSVLGAYDLTIFLLGKEYLRAVNLPSELEIPGSCVFFTGKGSQPYLPAGPPMHSVFLGNKDARRLGAGLVALKGRVMEILGEQVAQDPSLLESIIQSPENLTDFIRSYNL